MKAIITGDLHLKLWNDRDYDENGIPLKLIEILNTVRQMAEYATKNDIHHIIIAGDVNDTKGIVSVRAFVLFRQILEEYQNIQWIILHGNHDATSGMDVQQHSAIQLLEGYTNVRIVTEPVIEDSILYIPHSKDIVNVLKRYIEEGAPDVLISHFGIDEAQLSSGISIRAGIRASDLKKFKLVLLGHYHKSQELKYNKTKIYYTGSPIPVRRDEALEEKRFLVVDFDTFEVLSIPTEGYRRYCEIILNESTDIDEFKQIVKQYNEAGHHVVVKNMLADIPLDLKQVVSNNVQLIDLYEKDINLRGITSDMSVEQQLLKYLEIMGVAEDERKEYLEVGLNIISNYCPEEKNE